MTYEEFREEMKNRGMTAAQINSVGVNMALDIINESGELFSDLSAVEREIELKKRDLGYVKRDIFEAKQRKEKIEQEARKVLEDVKAAKSDAEEYTENFAESLKKTETPEARDALRTAQMFTNTVRIESAYDNTAFINGLAAILAGKQIHAPESMHRVGSGMRTEKTPKTNR